MQVWYDEYGPDRFVPISINLWQDMEGVVKPYARQYTYPFLRDNGYVWGLYNINNYIPLNYVIDTAGVVVGGTTGFDETQLRNWIESVLPPLGVEEGRLEVARIDGVRPSPAAGPATVRLAMSNTGSASVRVWSSSGRLVRELFTGELAAGPTEFTWNLADTRGERVPAGTYFVELNAAGQSTRAKLSVLD